MLRANVVFIAGTLLLTRHVSIAIAGPYAPAAGQIGSDAIDKSSPLFKAWATDVVSTTRGPQNISNLVLGDASFGVSANALGAAQGTATDVVSLGDGGQITLNFSGGIRNGAGPDFAVFENGFGDAFLELAFVEVSSDGNNLFRFPSVSLTQTSKQIGGFDPLDPTNLYDLAGKHRAGFGTPFDLSELVGVSPFLDVNHVTQVRIVDVVGSIDPLYATHDSLGNIVNEPWPTAFDSGGFDLDAVGVLHAVPEPGSRALLLAAVFGMFAIRQTRGHPLCGQR